MAVPTVRKYTIKFSEKGAEKVKGEVSKIDKAFAGLQSQLVGLATAGAAFAASFVTFKAINIAGEFEALRVRLQNMFGSLERGTAAFNKFKEVAASTPFSVREVVEAGASLKAFGLDAENSIKVTADLAAFMGVSIPEAASAFGRAFAGGAGAADIFRERGILNLIKMRRGIDDFTKISIKQFREAMFKTFNDPKSGIAGATDKLANTFKGAVSNAQDAVEGLGAAIGEKLLPSVTASTKEFSKFVDNLTTIVTFADTVIEKFIGLNDWFVKNVAIGRQINKGWEDFVGNIDDSATALRVQNNLLNSETALIEKATNLFRRRAEQQKAATQAMEEFSRSIDKSQRKAISKLPKQLEESTFQAEKFLEQTKFIAGSLKEIEITTERLTPQQSQFWAMMSAGALQLADVLEFSILRQFREGGSVFSNFADDFVDMLERMAAAIIARAAIFGIASTILSFATGGGFGGIGAAFKVLGGIGSILGGLFAEGGRPPLGRVSVVGESGPELFIPDEAGTVVPAGQNISITINAVDALSFKQMLRERGGARVVSEILSEVG